MHHDLITPPVHLRLRGPAPPHALKRALRAILDAAHLLGLAAGVHLRQLRAARDPLADALARLREAEIRERLAWETVDLLGSRLDKIPERRRPYYSPPDRFRILEIKNLLGWSQAQSARLLPRLPEHHRQLGGPRRSRLARRRLHRQAPPACHPIRRCRARQHPDARTAGTWRSGPRGPRPGSGRLEGVRSLGRPHPPRTPAQSATAAIASTPQPSRRRSLRPPRLDDGRDRRAVIPGGQLHLAGAFDAFSHVPLALQLFDRPPGAAAMARLLRRAGRACGQPKHLITDLGPEFTGRAFQKAAARLGIASRSACKQNLYATARLERFWRTLKDTARLQLLPPLTTFGLERRLELALAHYLCLRPHQGLAGATPAEAFLGVPPAHQHATSPPRGQPGEGPLQAPFTVDFLDRERRTFSFLTLAS